MAKHRVRTMRMSVHDIKVQERWSSSTLTLTQYVDQSTVKRVTIEIERPDDIAYLRHQLDKIEASWRASLDAIKVRP